MGNEASHERYCCGQSDKFERLTTEQKTPVTDPPIAQAAPGAALCSENCLSEEKLQDTATGMQNEDVGRENEIASCSLPVAQAVVRTAELQELGESQPSAEQPEQTENKPVTPSPDRQTCAPAQESPAAAQQAQGAAGLTTTDLPLQTPTGAGDAEDVVTEQRTVEVTSAACRRPRCKPSPVCRWLKKLRSPAEKAQVKPEAITSKE